MPMKEQPHNRGGTYANPLRQLRVHRLTGCRDLVVPNGLREHWDSAGFQQHPHGSNVRSLNRNERNLHVLSEELRKLRLIVDVEVVVGIHQTTHVIEKQILLPK